MLITGTFLDEISHDIPHQNWGYKEWESDFQSMKSVGIDTVILIRCGHNKFITYPSQVMMKRDGCYKPPVDLIDLFLELAEKYGMKFFFGTYDAGRWYKEQYKEEAEINKAVVEEAWAKYGSRKAFKGWYLNQEISRSKKGVVDIYAGMGRFCKEISGGLPVMISPYIDGTKAVWAFDAGKTKRADSVTVEQHAKEWDEILSATQGAIDIVAFQDGHCDYEQLADFLAANKELAIKHGMQSWTNCETFDRDMPIKFLPIKWEKMLLKLEAAGKAGLDKAITFEFSHFMSPNSCYLQAKNLYERYREHFGV